LIPVLLPALGAPTDTIRDLNGRVSIHNHEVLTYEPVEIRAVAMNVLNKNDVYIQIWRRANSTEFAFTLRWQKKFDGFKNKGHHVVST
jgi:hypothetical protein